MQIDVTVTLAARISEGVQMSKSPHSFRKGIEFLVSASLLCLLYTVPALAALTAIAVVTGFNEPLGGYAYAIVFAVWLAKMWKTNALKVIIFLMDQPTFIQEYKDALNREDYQRCRYLEVWMGKGWGL